MKHEKATHIDLFSGIGGFSLAADTVFGKENFKHVFVEWDAFCQAVLRKYWPEAEYHSDIRAFVADAADKRRERERIPVQPRQSREAGTDFDRPYLITGGFPCQPFSLAGRRKGTADDRYLWPPMLEAISIFKPEWVIAENVAGLASWNDGLVLETVCVDLEREGYEVQPFIIPACAIGAPHRRDRIWIVARNTEHDGQHASKKRKGSTAGSDDHAPSQNEDEQSSGSAMSRHTPADSENIGSGRRNGKRRAMERKLVSDKSERYSPWSEGQRRSWIETGWPKVAAQLCTVDDGLPDGLVRPRGWRNAALKAAGNAIVPQVAMEIMRAIKNIDGRENL